MKTTSKLGTCAALAALALVATPETADAGKKSKKDRRDIELVRPTAAPDADALGTLRISVTKRGEKGVLKLRNLDPKTRYEVHDAATDEVLGTVRTNRRGKAKLKIRRKVRSVGKKAAFEMPDEIEVCRVDDDTPLLIGEIDAPAADDLPGFAFGTFDGAEGFTAFVDMYTFPGEDMEGFHLSLFGEPTERGAESETYEYMRDTVAGDELPLGAESVGDLSGRAFRVVGPDGAVFVRGVLPDLERPQFRMPPEIDWGDGPELPFFGDRPNDKRPTDERPTDERPTDERANGDRAAKFGGLLDNLPEFDFEKPELDFEMPDFDFEKPDFDDFWMMPPDFFPFPEPEREESRLRLEIADDEGTLTDCGHLDRIVWPEIDWPEMDWSDVDWSDWRCPMDGEHGDGEEGDREEGDGETGSDERDNATDRTER